MNITFIVDDQVAQRAGVAAEKMDISLDQVVLNYLEQLAGTTQHDLEWAQLEQSCLTSSGRRNGWIFNRDKANQR